MTFWTKAHGQICCSFLSIDWPNKVSLLLLAFFQYLDKSNVYEILTSRRRRIIHQIDSISAFPSSTVFDTRVKWTWKNFNPSWSHQIERRAGNGSICFSQKKELFQGKNYAAFVNLLRATTMQKKSEFDFFELCRSFAILFDSLRICS